MTKKEIKDSLPLTECVKLFGTNKISKDLISVLSSEEVVVDVIYAKRKSFAATILDLVAARYFRSYMVITNQRLIYIERMELYKKVLEFDKKIIPEQIRETDSLLAITYSHLFQGESQGKTYQLSVNKDIIKYVQNQTQPEYQIEEPLCETKIVPMPSSEMRDIKNEGKKLSTEKVSFVDDKKFCVFCGQKMDIDWVCCPTCGKKAPIVEKMDVHSEQAVIQHNQLNVPREVLGNEQEKLKQENKVLLCGDYGRVIGGCHTVETEVLIEGDEVKVQIDGCQDDKVDYVVFDRNQIRDFKVKKRFYFERGYFVVIAVLMLLIPVLVTKLYTFSGINITWEMLLLCDFMVAVVFFVGIIFLSTTNKIEIVKNDGEQINIPVNEKRDTIKLLELIDYPYYGIEKLKRRSKNQKKNWKIKKILTNILVLVEIVVSSIVVWQIRLYQETRIIQGYEYKDGLTVKEILEDNLEGGQWNAYIYEGEKESYIAVGYMKDGLEYLFRYNEKEVYFQEDIVLWDVIFEGESIGEETTFNEFMEHMIFMNESMK